MSEDETLRLQVRLARAGLASRRQCEKFIADGRVMVNGRVVILPGEKVGPGDEVRFDNRLISRERRKVYVALNKPVGFLCSNADPDHRPLARSLLESKERLFHVGRLDYMSSGLIFYTNDGEFARILTHPSQKMEKEYIITTKGFIAEEDVMRFCKGITVKGVRYRASRVEVTGPRSARVVLTEGKNRELRRVFSSFSAEIKKVHRVRIGPVSVQGLSSGRFRHLKESEVKALMKGGGGEKHGRRD